MPSMMRVSWPVDLHRRLKMRAAEDGVTLSAVIERALLAYFDSAALSPRDQVTVAQAVITPPTPTKRLRHKLTSPVHTPSSAPGDTAALCTACGHPLTVHNADGRCQWGPGCSCKRRGDARG